MVQSPVIFKGYQLLKNPFRRETGLSIGEKMLGTQFHFGLEFHFFQLTQRL